MAWKPDYASAADLRTFMKIGDSLDDVQLALANTAAARAVDRACSRGSVKRQFGKVDASEQRFYDAYFSRRRGRWVVDIDDLYDADGIDVSTSAGAVSLVRLEPVNALKDGKVYTALSIDPTSTGKPTMLDPQVAVTSAKWGWPAFPVTVVDATLLQGSRFASRRTSPYGIAGSPDQGSELRLLARVDPDVAVMLGDYVRRGGRLG